MSSRRVRALIEIATASGDDDTLISEMALDPEFERIELTKRREEWAEAELDRYLGATDESEASPEAIAQLALDAGF